MGMKNVAGRDLQMLAQLHDSVSMSWIVEWKRKARELFRPGAGFQLTLFSADDDLAVTSLPEPSRQVQQLPLAAAQTRAGVDMNDLQGPRGSHWRWPTVAPLLASLVYFLLT
jgi:hypothetical protein